MPGDVRITTRYTEDDFTQSLMGVLHETGHALYEMGLPDDWRYQPVGQARGMALHESQSLLIEMHGRRIISTGCIPGSTAASSASTRTRSPIRPMSFCATGSKVR